MANAFIDYIGGRLNMAATFSYTVKTIPPAIYYACQSSYQIRTTLRHTTSRASRGVVPFQNPRIPFSVHTLYAQWNEFLYICWASSDCILVFTTLIGDVSILSGRLIYGSTYSNGIVV